MQCFNYLGWWQVVFRVGPFNAFFDCGCLCGRLRASRHKYGLPGIGQDISIALFLKWQHARNVERHY